MRCEFENIYPRDGRIVRAGTGKALKVLQILFETESCLTPNCVIHRPIRWESIEQIKREAEGYGFVFEEDPNWTDQVEWSDESQSYVPKPPTTPFYRFRRGEQVIADGLRLKEVKPRSES